VKCTIFFKFVKIRVGAFLITTSFRIYSEATTVVEELAVDDSCTVTWRNTMTFQTIHYTGHCLTDNN